jgi:lysophospholipid acyltransferase (LPLAT)-like uncharacterized protein
VRRFAVGPPLAVPPARAGRRPPLAALARLIGRTMAAYVRICERTCRFDGRATRDPGILVLWHGTILLAAIVALHTRRHLPHASFSTHGFRGEVVTAMLASLGGAVLPLPPEDDRAAARDLSLRLARAAAGGYSLTVTPDGPFGPYRVAKPGALIVGRASGLPLLPWGLAARPALRLRRWDQYIVPLPFGRIRLVEAKPIRVARQARIRNADTQALGLALDAATDLAEAGVPAMDAAL